MLFSGWDVRRVKTEVLTLSDSILNSILLPLLWYIFVGTFYANLYVFHLYSCMSAFNYYQSVNILGKISSMYSILTSSFNASALCDHNS